MADGGSDVKWRSKMTDVELSDYSMTIQDLEDLRSILNDSIDRLKSQYQLKSLDFPSLDEPYRGDAAEALAASPEVSNVISTIVAASYQLLATVRTPFLSALDGATAYMLSVCLRVTEQINAVEILREGSPDGVHINDLAAKTGMEPTKLARIFRVLATHHIFREVKPNVFANNRISSSYDTGKSTEWLASHPHAEKHEGTNGASALFDHNTDEIFKASAYLYETMLSPETSHSFSATKAPLQVAFNTDKLWWDWVEEPFNVQRFARYGAAIRGTSQWNRPEAILQGYEWHSLTPEDLVVDVGGGTGMPAMMISRAYPDVRIVIQDREAITEQGKAFWAAVYPEALESGRVIFQAHEFFDEQPVRNASVFILRTILHDWPDEECLKILKRLRAAAAPGTKLVIGDFQVPYACSDNGDLDIPGAQAPLPPKPLLANLGKSSFVTYAFDITMQVLLNGQERTTAHQVDLARRAGWRAVQLNRVESSCFGFLVAQPA
ncbi:O-methyltransferase [Heliocybe sulcata]|uniref:O-methyltransferase n=1 Tax=Heliocybe sulcata TaxID=5364 RepID=A0A5C3MSH1_9AGAM|nr:O-methyltransferase [Heliocybe sulcata]